MFFKNEEFQLIFAVDGNEPAPEIEHCFYNRKICRDYKIYSCNKASKHPELSLYYGPYECNRIIKHRPEKLHGLIDCLKNMSYYVNTIPVGNLNLLEVVCMGYVIYRFDIRYLKFNMRYEDDEACVEALNVISEAIDRLYGENNIIDKCNARNRNNRGTTISISSKMGLSYYENLF